MVPLFPFGHGLSYTSFTYSRLSLGGTPLPNPSIPGTFYVTNAGTVAGAEVVQVYIGYPAASGEPPKQLRFFSKVCLICGTHFDLWHPPCRSRIDSFGIYSLVITRLQVSSHSLLSHHFPYLLPVTSHSLYFSCHVSRSRCFPCLAYLFLSVFP